MSSIKETISGFSRSDYFSRVNLHIHSNFSDGLLSPKEIVKKAREAGLEYISITDHNTVEAYKHIGPENLNGLNLITGVEFDCWYRTDFMHILGYAIDVKNKELLDICAKTRSETRFDLIRIFSSRKAPDVIKTIKNAGGIAVLAHPACCWSLNIEKMVRELVSYGLDGLELYYPYVRHRKIVKFHCIKKIKKIAEKYQLLLTGGNDCHKSDLTTCK